MRAMLAQEAARVMAEQGVRDFRLAKRKAMHRLGVPLNSANMPRNAEVESALRERQRLFQGGSQPGDLKHLRESCLQALRFFGRFRPRVVGAVLDGTADRHAPLCLHVFAATSEEVVLFLMQHNIPYETKERRLRWPGGVQAWLPVYCFNAGDVAVDLTVFSDDCRRDPPLSAVDGKPMSRAGLNEVQRLLDQPGEHNHLSPGARMTGR